MAVTREGIPVRVWSWPGNTGDSALIRQVKEDLAGWTLSRIVWVADRGFSSAENRRYLRRGDHHYIIGERLRAGSALAQSALSRAGRYQEVRENLRVKEVRLRAGERFVICHNPEAAERDAAVRARLVARLTEMIADTDLPVPDEAGRTAGRHLHQARPSPLSAHDCGWAPAHRRAGDSGRGEARRQVSPAFQRPLPLGRGHSPWLQAAPRGGAGLAGHEARS